MTCLSTYQMMDKICTLLRILLEYSSNLIAELLVETGMIFADDLVEMP